MILGVHCSLESSVIPSAKSQTISEAINRDLDEYGLNAAQIFVAGPRTNTLIKMDYEEIKKQTEKITLYVHASYPTVGIWKAESESDLGTFINQVRVCAEISASGFVVHLPKRPAKEIAKVMTLLLPIVKRHNVLLLLEHISCKPSENSHETPDKLDTLITEIDKYITEDLQKYYGIVIDTAHMWGCGYNNTSVVSMFEWFKAFNRKDKIRLFHLNGSSSNLLDGKDQHQVPFSEQDNIWFDVEPEKSGLFSIVTYATVNNIPIICEINRGEKEDIESCLSIIKKISTGEIHQRES